MRKIYQIYVEYFFLLNFVFLFCTWNVSTAFLDCSVTQKKMLVASFFGAVGSCFFLYIPVLLWLRLLLGAVFGCLCGIRILFSRKNGYKGYWKYLFAVLLTAVLLGGSIALIQKGWQKNEFTTWQIVGMTVLLSGAVRILLQYYFHTKRVCFYSVTLLCGEKEYVLKALLDTGNSLVEPLSQKAVCIVGRDVFEQDMVKEGERNIFPAKKFRAIPYHSIGEENGILCGYEMDRLIIHTDERKIVIEKPMIGISRVPVGSPASYQMILQPKLLREGEH